MQDKLVVWRIENGICHIAMNSPKTLNALSIPIIEGLDEAFSACFADEVRAVVLSANGPAFCAGGDLPSAVEYGARAWLLESVKMMANVANMIRRLPKPVLASINGSCFGVGMSLAMMCDLRIAAESAVLKQAYTSVGLSPDVGWTLTVPRLIGAAKAMEFLMLDPAVPAQEALRLGLVNKVVPDDALAAETAKMAARLAGGATKAFAASKELVNTSMFQGIEAQIEKERWKIADSADTDDFREGFDAVFNKRKPNYTGK